MIDDTRAHIRRIEQIYEPLEKWFELGPLSRGSYLHRWNLDLELREPEEALIAGGKLPATGVRFSGRRRPGRS